MNILTTKDIAEAIGSHNYGPDILNTFRLAESAVIKKLATVSLKLFTETFESPDDFVTITYYSPALVRTALAAARVQAINECADTAKNLFCFDEQGIRISSQCEQAIRALLGGSK